ncbi:hypothetical protein BHM03_00014862 [Ensete ventricosum]|nr:hypothetical protein BHM03_00014862 [Ensete ventricosum]
MGKGSKSASHQLFKDKARNRVDDLQEMFTDLQSALKESRAADVAVLEEQVHQMLREWRAELNQASPATSLQLSEEEDDATSKLTDLAFRNTPKPEQVEFQQADVGATQGLQFRPVPPGMGGTYRCYRCADRPLPGDSVKNRSSTAD